MITFTLLIPVRCLKLKLDVIILKEIVNSDLLVILFLVQDEISQKFKDIVFMRMYRLNLDRYLTGICICTLTILYEP